MATENGQGSRLNEKKNFKFSRRGASTNRWLNTAKFFWEGGKKKTKINVQAYSTDTFNGRLLKYWIDKTVTRTVYDGNKVDINLSKLDRL